MVTCIYEADQVSVPSWVVDLASFRRWADEEDFPEKGRVWFLKGEVCVDMSKQQVFTHVLVKGQFTTVLTTLVETYHLGFFLPDGLFLSNVDADLAAIPDGTFVSTETLRRGRARLVEARSEGYVEIEGSPDMVLEIVSRSSIYKDNVQLRQAYWEAGVREFWLVDVRSEPLAFSIFRHTARGYVASRKQGDWIKSGVFGKSFRLIRSTGELGHPQFRLDVR
jgi:Uma2 family endonuclease